MRKNRAKRGGALSLSDRAQFRFHGDYPSAIGQYEIYGGTPGAPKMFTRIGARKHIKLHDTSESTANVARPTATSAAAAAAAAAMSARGAGRSFVYFILFAVEFPLAPTTKSDIIVNIDPCHWAKLDTAVAADTIIRDVDSSCTDARVFRKRALISISKSANDTWRGEIQLIINRALNGKIRWQSRAATPYRDIYSLGSRRMPINERTI